MVDTEALEKVISDSGIKKYKLAEALEISQPWLAAKIAGREDFKISEVAKLCKALKINNVTRNKIFFNWKVTK